MDDFQVLDKGYVRFIEKMGTEETIIEAARMSVGRGFISWDPYVRCDICGATELGTVISSTYCTGGYAKDGHTKVTKMPRGDQGLLGYLYKNGHTTPFEMCQLHVEINAPIMVWRQLHRHRVFSYNEQSGRYGELQDAYYVPSIERIKETFRTSQNKQAKGGGIELSDVDALYEQKLFETEQVEQRARYKGRLERGMAPELARGNVGVFQYSKCRVSGDLHNLLHSLLRLRLHSHAQYEIRVYAEAIAHLIAAQWPRTYALFEENTRYAVKLSRTDRKKLLTMLKAYGADPATGNEELYAKLSAGI